MVALFGINNVWHDRWELSLSSRWLTVDGLTKTCVSVWMTCQESQTDCFCCLSVWCFFNGFNEIQYSHCRDHHGAMSLAVNVKHAAWTAPSSGLRCYSNPFCLFVFTALHYPQQHPAAPCPAGENVWVDGGKTGLYSPIAVGVAVVS